MTGLFICAAVSLAIFALAALADERWPDRLSRRGHHLRGQKWQGHWGAVPTYGASARRAKPSAAVRA
jgi:hypothetical protein